MSDTAFDFTSVDRLLHEPARLMIISLLSAVKEADFLYLLHETGLTRGNLSSHISKLEEAGYIKVEKTFRGKIPLTTLKLTTAGIEAFTGYREHLRQLVKKLDKQI